MKIFCSPSKTLLDQPDNSDVKILLYGLFRDEAIGSAGESIIRTLRSKKLLPEARAFDLLSIALAITSADYSSLRVESVDGWTRSINLTVAVVDVEFWNTVKDLLEEQLRFLTTDIWKIEFISDGYEYPTPSAPISPELDSIVLLSGGLDSLIGAIDLSANGLNLYAVSQVSKGDKGKQVDFASSIGAGLNHIQLNHNVRLPYKNNGDISQRARSFLFLAYGVLLATTLKKYKDEEEVILYMCENGFIGINPPLTVGHLGSHSTRTAHPHYLGLFQELLKKSDIKVRIVNPYRFKTKGEMLLNSPEQGYLRQNAHKSTSCGKVGRINQQCGRCVPCIIRRASFHKWNVNDGTDYKYPALTRNGQVIGTFLDVKSVAIAVLRAQSEGVEKVIGANLASPYVDNLDEYKSVVSRGLEEIRQFLISEGVC